MIIITVYKSLHFPIPQNDRWGMGVVVYIAEYVATGIEVVVVSINHGPPLPTHIKTIPPFFMPVLLTIIVLVFWWNLVSTEGHKSILARIFVGNTNQWDFQGPPIGIPKDYGNGCGKLTILGGSSQLVSG